jgi:hypothetical protein
MDEIRLSDILNDQSGAEPTPEVYGRIVARHQRRRARRYQLVVATSAAVIALAGVGVTISTDHSGRPALSAAGSTPPGLSWNAGTSSQTPAKSGRFAEASATGSKGGAMYGLNDPAPGSFGFSEGQPASPAVPAATNATGRGSSFGTAEPVLGNTSFGVYTAPNEPSPCTSKGCDVIFGAGTRRLLFTRHVGGFTVAASLLGYLYPMSPVEIGPVTAVPVVSGAPATASRGGKSSPPSSAPAPSVIKTRPIPVVTTCPVEAELVVTVTDGSFSDTLYVPAGGPTSHAFSVVASAAAKLTAGGSLVLAVARVSSSVSSVSAEFPGGGSDSMRPVAGWAVLAHQVNGSVDLGKAGAVALVAKSVTGSTLETAKLPATGALATAPLVGTCHLLMVPLNASSVAGSPGPSTGSSGSGTTGSGTTGSGTTGSGTTGSGTGLGAPPLGKGTAP